MHYLYLAIAIVSEVIATTSLKASGHFTKLGPSIVCLVGYGCALFFLAAAIESIKLGVAYAVWTGVGMILITILAFVVHDQKVDFPAVAGITLIIAGVVIIYAFSQIELR